MAFCLEKSIGVGSPFSAITAAIPKYSLNTSGEENLGYLK
jgi:hypothetical protein